MPRDFLEISNNTVRFLPEHPTEFSIGREYFPTESENTITDIETEPIGISGPVGIFPLIDDLPSEVRANAYLLTSSMENCARQDLVRDAQAGLHSVDWYNEDPLLINAYLEYLIGAISGVTYTGPFADDAHADDVHAINKPDGRSALMAPVGLEISYRAPGDRVDVYIKKLTEFLKPAGLLRGYGSRIYRDSGSVLEVCSPVIKTMSGISEWFDKVHTISRSIGLVYMPRKVASGGMHINMSFNKNLPNWKLAYVNLFTMFANHPEINWVFNDPADLGSAKCMALNSRYQCAYHSLVQNDMILSDDIWSDFSVCGGKESAVNVKDGHHFEVRTFQMPRSTSEMVDMLDFLNSLVEFCSWSAECGMVIPLEIGVPDMVCDAAEDRGYLMTSDTYSHCYLSKMWYGEESFKFLLETLGLDPKRYRKYVRRNYHVRRALPYGKTYMV
jgi:hypothetical protein